MKEEGGHAAMRNDDRNIRCVALGALACAAVVGAATASAQTAGNPPPHEEAAPTEVAPAPATAAAVDSAPPEPPRQLEVGGGTGFFRPGILLQGWYVADFTGTTSNDIANMFRIRRAELSAQGEVVPGLVAYKLMIDPAKVLEFGSANIDVTPADPDNPDEQVTIRQPVSAVSMFQDFYVTFQVPYVDISLGQFKIPVSWEAYNSTARLLFPERAQVVRSFGDRRDLGIRLAKKFDWFGYSAGVFNGAGQNNFDTNNTKDLALRLEGYPVEGLTVAGVVYMSVGDRDQPGTRDRYEGDLRFERWGLLFQGEYIYGHDRNASGTEVSGQGFYAALAYTFLGALQPCVRVGYFDPNIDEDGTGNSDELWQIDAGLNWYIQQNDAKLQISYSRFQYDQRTANNEVIVAAQVAY
jgi:hypothetical protein